MKLVIDIPDEDYTSVRCEALYYIGHDKLAESVTTAFQTAIPYEERPQGKKIKKRHYGWVYCSECDSLLGQQDKFCWNCGADMRGGAE